MKHFTLIFAASLFVAIVAVPQPKSKAVPVDEVDLMLQKISSHLQEASVATAQAHEMGEKMVEHKRLVIPGYVSVMSGKLEELTGWKISVGPREASGIPVYLRNLKIQ